MTGKASPNLTGYAYGLPGKQPLCALAYPAVEAMSHPCNTEMPGPRLGLAKLLIEPTALTTELHPQ